MELVALNCNQCGAKLTVGEDTKFVTCKHCNTQLAVRHEDGAAFTDVVAAAERAIRSLEAQTEKLSVQGEIDRLDHDWERDRQALMVRKRNGELVVPTRSQAVVVMVVAPLMIFPLVAGVIAGAKIPEVMWIFGCVMVVLVFFSALNLLRKAAAYQAAFEEYQSKRSALVSKLES